MSDITIHSEFLLQTSSWLRNFSIIPIRILAGTTANFTKTINKNKKEMTYWSVIKTHQFFFILGFGTINFCITYLLRCHTYPLILFVSGWTIKTPFSTQRWRTFWNEKSRVKMRLYLVSQLFRSHLFYLTRKLGVMYLGQRLSRKISERNIKAYVVKFSKFIW